MNIAIVSAGYVGINTGVALAYLGHQVMCLDTDEECVGLLRRGRFPIYEPHLESLAALARPRLRFSTTASEAEADADVIFIAVGTPPLADGNPDLSELRAAALSVGDNLGEGFTVAVNKSTVPIGCGNWVESVVREAFEAPNGLRPRGASRSPPIRSFCARARRCMTRCTPTAW